MSHVWARARIGSEDGSKVVEVGINGYRGYVNSDS